MSNTPPLATAGWKSLDLPAFGGGGHPTDIDKTLADRGKRYGNFMGHSNITQRIKAAMHGTGNWGRLEDDQREALDMIAHKIGRILNGDPNYHDSWYDIVGYTKLVADRLLQTMPVAAAPAPKTETIPWVQWEPCMNYAPKGRVHVLLRNGNTSISDAIALSWSRSGAPDDIMAYHTLSEEKVSKTETGKLMSSGRVPEWVPLNDMI